MNLNDPKSMAKVLRKALREQQIELSHGACLEIVALQCGYANWNVLAARSQKLTSLTAAIFVKHGRELEAASFYEVAFSAIRRGEHIVKNGPCAIDLLIGEQEFTVAGANPHREKEPSLGGPFSPGAKGGVSTLFRLYVDDAERTLIAAVIAGATIRDGLQTSVSGERAASIFDPFGHLWGIVERAPQKRLKAA
jgi:PhnB protein